MTPKKLEYITEDSVINSYKRLAYTPWHAIAEFIDNSTQSFFNNRKVLEEANRGLSRPLEVKVDYDVSTGVFRIEDNAMGMSFDELASALHVSRPPKNANGRSQFGMGMKTAASWL